MHRIEHIGRIVTGLMMLSFTMIACSVAQTPTPSNGGESESGGHAAHGAMDHADMSQTAPGDAFDLQFIDGMTAHHNGAIVMAQEALVNAEHEEVKALAEAIVAAQTSEVAQMQQWRDAWFPNAEETPTDEIAMGDMEVSTDEAIPFDQRFVESMISHHLGAVTMAELARDKAGREEIRTLAESVIAAQNAEIEMMRGWLREWYGIE